MTDNNHPQTWVLNEFSALREAMSDGFEKLRDEIHEQNGRVTAGEIDRAEMRGKIAVLELKSTIKNAHIHNAEASVVAASMLTRRDGWIMGLALSAVVALIKILDFLITKLWTIVTSGMKGV